MLGRKRLHYLVMEQHSVKTWQGKIISVHCPSKFLFSGLLGFQPPSLLTQCLILLLASIMFRLWYSKRKVLEKWKIPGPWPLPFVGNLTEFVVNNYGSFLLCFLYFYLQFFVIDVAGTICKIMDRFNGFAQIWVGRNPVVLISDPDHLKIFYTNVNMIDRADQYDHIGQILGKDSIFVANGLLKFSLVKFLWMYLGLQWKKVRKMMIMAFHPTPNETFYKNFLITEKDLSKSLTKKSNGSTFPCKFIIRTLFMNSILRKFFFP